MLLYCISVTSSNLPNTDIFTNTCIPVQEINRYGTLNSTLRF
jgi:hypothetical protein